MRSGERSLFGGLGRAHFREGFRVLDRIEPEILDRRRPFPDCPIRPAWIGVVDLLHEYAGFDVVLGDARDLAFSVESPCYRELLLRTG